MELGKVRTQKEINVLIDYYAVDFKVLFGTHADTEGAGGSLFPILQKYGLQKAKALVSGFLRLDDEWLRKRGYPLRHLQRELNAVIVSTAPEKDIRPKYLVAYTESGGSS